MRTTVLILVLTVALLPGCGDDGPSDAAAYADTLAELDGETVVLRRSTFAGLPEPFAPPSMWLEVRADGTATAYDIEAGRYEVISLPSDELAEFLQTTWAAGEGLSRENRTDGFEDCGGDSVEFLEPDGDLRTITWDCADPDRAVMALFSDVADRVTTEGTPVPVDTAPIETTAENRAVLSIERVAGGCSYPTLVVRAGGRVTTTPDGRLAEWEIGREAVQELLPRLVDAARATPTDAKADPALVVHAVVGRVPDGPLIRERMTIAEDESDAVLALVAQRLSIPVGTPTRDPDIVFVSTGPSVSDPSTAEPPGPELSELASFDIAPSDQRIWTDEISGNQVAELLAAADAGRVEPGRAWIIPDRDLESGEATRAALTCHRPDIADLSPKYGIEYP